MALTFDLVQALNNTGTAGLAVFGNFSCGYYIGYDWNTYTIFDRYQYVGGNSFTPGNPYDTSTELGWMDSTGYPHVGIENINGNAQIETSLWNESIYFHPKYFASGPPPSDPFGPDSKPCVIRFTSPYNGTLLGVAGNFLKGLTPFNQRTGFAILKNGVNIQSRVVADNGTPSIAINISNVPINAGDIIDFVLDADTDNDSGDDSAITLNVSLQLTQTPQPSPNPINCTDTTVSGTIPLVQSGTVTLQTVGGGTVLGTGTITPVSGTVNGQWSITGLNLNSYGGQSLELVAVDSPSTPSTPLSVAVGNIGCIVCVPPTITTQPIGATLCTSALPHGFSVVASGSAPFSYQWKLNGTDISGATSSSHSASTAGSYTVVVTNACGNVTSNAAVLTVNTPPTLIGANTLPNASVGAAYSHSFSFNGTLPFSLSNIIAPSWLTISLSGNTVSLSGTPIIGDEGAAITVSFDVSNSCDTYLYNNVFDVILGCTAVSGGVISGPTEVIAGQSGYIFSIGSLSGTTPYTYAWSTTNGSIVGSTANPSAEVLFTGAGTVTCVVTNACGSVSRNYTPTLITADAVNDTVSTLANTAVVINLSANDVVCN
jgi:hypothetical protein